MEQNSTITIKGGAHPSLPMRPEKGENSIFEHDSRYTQIMADKAYHEVEHTADWALRVKGEDLAELLENAALGMLDLAGAEAEDADPKLQTFDIEADDGESLLVTWLEEILFQMETRRVTFKNFQVEVPDDLELRGSAEEYPLKRILKFIKAVTYYGLEIESGPDGLSTTIVFDV
jgi:SHS2 domain-containing protein